MAIRIGANPIGWSNDDMQEIGGWIPLEQCLSEAKAAGFVGMELGNKFPREAAKLRPILDKYGHALIGGWHSIFLIERDAETEFAEAAHHRKLLKDMGTPVFIVAECTRTIHGDKSKPLSTRPKMTEAEWKRFTTRLTRLALALPSVSSNLVSEKPSAFSFSSIRCARRRLKTNSATLRALIAPSDWAVCPTSSTIRNFEGTHVVAAGCFKTAGCKPAGDSAASLTAWRFGDAARFAGPAGLGAATRFGDLPCFGELLNTSDSQPA